ncbi:MAG TPA: hypothetical protein VEW28_07375 [Candidatus Kapabacteria bacterium]|nr:hypothetical protein [Candidatus Kapabacteria bacterium]
MTEESVHHSHGNTVLVIAYYFPPMGLSGVQRTAKFVKYLPKFGWKPVVLTTPTDTPYYAFDESLEAELEDEIREGNIIIYRTDADPSLSRASKTGRVLKLPSQNWQRTRSKFVQFFRQPDSRIGWKDIALRSAEQIFEHHQIDAIFSTAPPYTDFLIARELSDRFGVPYLIDYRDGWVDNEVLNKYLTPLHKRKARTMEYEVIRASSAITTANRRMKELLLENYIFLDWDDVTILPQGYDPDDIERAVPLANSLYQPEVFRLTYAGAFYVDRTPKPMFDAVKELITEIPELDRVLELNFVGVLQKEYQKLAKKMGLDHLLAEQGYLPHLESVAHLLSSDVLWMTMSDDVSAPGKLYEYFGTHKPILALVPKGSRTQKQLVEYGNAIVAEPDNVQEIKSAILQYYRLWKERALTTRVNENFVKIFDRSKIAKELAMQLTFISGSLDGEIRKLRRKAR